MSGKRTLTERNGVHTLEGLILATKRALTYFNIADKRVSWDGEIELYPSTADLETKNMLGKIPVQIKTETHPFDDKEKINDSTDVRDLINYRNSGGCLYFIIHVCDGEPPRIYYNALLPSDINQVLEQAKGQTTKTINFKKFPSDSETIVALLRSFIDNRKKQTSTEDCVYISGTPLMEKLHDIEGFEFSLQGTNRDPFTSIFDIPTYVYAKPKIGPLIPFNKMDIAEFTMGAIRAEVWFNGKKYYGEVMITKTKDSEAIKIGKALTFNSDGRFDYRPIGTLFEQIVDTEFFVDICKNPNKELQIGSFASGFVNDSICPNLIKDTENHLSGMRAIRAALEYFGVFRDLEYDALTENDFNQLRTLVAVSTGGLFKSNPSPNAPVCNITIGNLNMALYVKEMDGGYVLANFFILEDYSVKIATTDGLENEASPFIVLGRNQLSKLDNINFDVMKQSITSKKYAPLYAVKVNDLLLEVLHAYDVANRADLLDFAIYIANWMTKHENIAGYSLNRLQAIKRQRQFTDEEVGLLVSIKNSTEHDDIALGVCILLENYIEARHYWAKLSDNGKLSEIQSAFVEFPIFSLWKENRPKLL